MQIQRTSLKKVENTQIALNHPICASTIIIDTPKSIFMMNLFSRNWKTKDFWIALHSVECKAKKQKAKIIYPLFYNVIIKRNKLRNKISKKYQPHCCVRPSDSCQGNFDGTLYVELTDNFECWVRGGWYGPRQEYVLNIRDYAGIWAFGLKVEICAKYTGLHGIIWSNYLFPPPPNWILGPVSYLK